MTSGKTSILRSKWVPWIVLGFCLLALGLRVYVRYGPSNYLFYGTSATARPESDAITWYLHSANMSEGRGFGENIKQFPVRNFVPPGHPFVLGAIQMITGNDPARVGWMVALLSGLVPFFTFLWVREMWGTRIGLWASFISVIHAPFMHISFSVMSEPSAILSGSIALYFGARALRRQGMKDVLLAGLIFGLAALIRPAVLAFLWGALTAVFFIPRMSWKKKLVMATTWLMMTLIPQGIWQYRNYLVHDQWSTVYSSISARHAWTGIHPEYAPYFYSRGSWHVTMWRDPYATEMEYIQRMQKEANEWISQDRFKHAMSCIWRMGHLYKELKYRMFDLNFSQGGWGGFYFLVTFVLTPLGAILALRSKTKMRTKDGVNELPGSFWSSSLLVGTAVALIGAGIYGASARYRWPLEFVWLPFLAILLDRLSHLTKRSFWDSETYEFDQPETTPRKKLAVRIVTAGLILYVGCFSALLVARTFYLPTPEESAVVHTDDQLEERLNELGLLEEWNTQDPSNIKYEEVLEEQKQNFGEVISYKNRLVIWWGIVRLPVIDDNGLHSGYVILEPTPENRLGTARLSFFRHKDTPSLTREWKDGDIVTFIARIQFEKGYVARPNLMVYDALPGRLAPAED